MRLCLMIAALALVGPIGCDGARTAPPDTLQTTEEKRRSNFGKLFGEDALTFRPGARSSASNGGGAGIGVNAYLWRATLDTMAFMPLASADPFGGVVISDWYSPPESPAERFKVNVLILGTQLRSDGIRASVFRQENDPADGWRDARVADDTAARLEDAILTRARQLRVASAGG